MNLRRKTLFLIGITFLCLVVLLYSFSTFIIIDGFKKVEQRDVEINVNRVQAALLDKISVLNGVVGDWSAWNETYYFVNGENPNFVEEQIADRTFNEIGLNLMLFINSTGGVVYGSGFDLNNKKPLPIPEGMKEYLSADSILLRHQDTSSNITGIILLPEGPMIIASRPILTNDGEGPIRGSVIWGRFLDDKEIEALGTKTHLTLSVHLINDPNMPSDFVSMVNSFSDQEKILVQPLSEGSIAGYTILNDINGAPALILRADMPRDIYQQGKTSINLYFVALFIIGLIFGSMIIFLLEKQVLSRLVRLNSDVVRIGMNGDLSKLIAVEGSDEFSSLAGSINKMTNQLKINRDHLENLVEERTKELKIINTQLQHEIVERIETENALHKSETKTRSIYEAIPDMLFTINKAAVFVGFKAAKGMEPIMPPQAFLGKKVSEVLPPRLAEELLKHIENVLLTGTPILFEYKLPQKDSIHDFEAKISRISADEVLGIVRDITDRKKFENILKEKEERFRSVTQSANDAIITVDSKGDIIFWNNGAQKIFGYGIEEVVGKPITFLMPEIYRDQHINGLKRLVATGESHIIGKTVELSGIKKDGSLFPLELSVSTWNVGEDIFFTGILRDITERKKAEEKIRASLEEKELLLREIHHRVKNNMQIISSLLRLQSQNIEDKNYRDIYIGSQTRIQSMALIHEKLYQSESLADINFTEYINGIVSNIIESYGQKSNIKFDINGENIQIKIDYAVPCGLIINEIVTNSFKYAFPNKRPGTIKISVKSKDNNMIQLLISDDGIGISKDLDIRNTKSLGLRLITSLAEGQLHGDITLNRENGTEFIINFKQAK